MRISPRAYVRLCSAALVLLATIVVTGASVRLTGSGLGCPTWPNCAEGQLVAPTESHAMIEFTNRMFTGAVSIAVIATVLGSLLRSPRRTDLTRWSLGLVFGVLGQIVLGGAVVLLALDPIAVIGHFLLSMILLWNAVVLRFKAGQLDRRPRPDGSHRWHGWWLGFVLTAAITTGTIVTASGPHAGDDDARRLPLVFSEVARVHAVTVIALVMTVVWLTIRRSTSAPAKSYLRALLVLLVAQAALGYTQYFTGVPVLLVGFHVLGATLVWCVGIRTCLELRTPEGVIDLRTANHQAVYDYSASLPQSSLSQTSI